LVHFNSIISVIVCTKDRKDELNRFIQSLDKQTVLPTELIIVDASKNTKTAKYINDIKQSPNYIIKYIKTDPGLTRQRNIGIKASNGKYIYFFDDDVVIANDFIEVIINTFNEFKSMNIGGITGRITNIPVKNSFIDQLVKKLFFLTAHGNGRLKLSGFPAHQISDQLKFVEVLSGGCTAYVRDVFKKYAFDEILSGYSYLEDVDFSYRVSSTFKLIYQPKAKLKHLSTTHKTKNSRNLRKMMVRHHLYLFKKNVPKDIPHKLAFSISIIGLFIVNAFLSKDLRACKGILEGLLKPL
jgi:GT2 family glycosyltransferase